MNVLVNALFGSGNEIFPPGAAPKHLLGNLIGAARKCLGGQPPVALTDNPTLAEMLPSLGCRAELTTGSHLLPGESPAGFDTLDAALAQAPRLFPQGGSLLVVDARCPNIGLLNMSSCLEAHAESGLPAASVKSIKLDHPVWCSQGFAMLHNDVYAPLDAKQSPHAYGLPVELDETLLVSRPLALAWDKKRLEGPGPYYEDLWRGDLVYRSGIPKDKEMPKSWWVRQGNLARRVWRMPRQCTDQDLVALSCHNAPHEPIRILSDQDGLRMVMPSNSAGADEQVFAFVFDARGRLHRKIQGRAGGLRLKLPSPQCGVWRMAVAAQASECLGMDFTVPFCIPGLWHYDHEQGVYVNDNTGRKIHGRQDLPPIFRPDGVLLACDTAQAPRAREQIFAGNFRPLHLSARAALRVVTPFNLCQYRAWHGNNL